MPNWTPTTLTNLKISQGQSIAPAGTANITLTGNLNSQTPAPTTGNNQAVTVPVTLYNTLGAAQNAVFSFTPTGGTPPAWSWTATVGSGSTKTTVGTGTATFGSNGQLNPGSSTGTVTLAGPGGTTQTVTVNLAALTEYAATSQVQGTADGSPAGVLENFSIGSSGAIVGTFSNGLTAQIGQLAMAGFSNPAGLLNVGNGQWQQSGNSGTPQVGTPATGSLGSLQAGVLEGSNVNLANEFVNMIIAQQGYQANAKVITIAQQLRTSLVNMVQ